MGVKSVRVLALAVLQRRDGKFLLQKGEDTLKNEIFYSCMGGGIEFGETGAQALVREFKEEIDKDIIVDVFLGAVENIFEWQGQAGHEIILLYKCRFAASSDYGQDEIPRVDENPGYVHWKSIRDIEAENALLHPQQVFKRLKENNL